ncbi:MAG: hypothetical protein ACOYVJ_02370 [Nitrospirota bacterium]
MKQLLSIENEARRRAFFIALLSKEMTQRGAERPIVVGGEAVELYTQGRYTTGDIDIKGHKETLEAVLGDWGFVKEGRVWVSREYDLYLDWLGGSLDEGAEAERRTNSIVIAPGLEVRVISFEDLIVGRLCAAKYWDDSDSLMWAKILIEILMKTGGGDPAYLIRRAEKENIADFLSPLLPKGETR